MSGGLKLAAMDAEDLQMLSVWLQDAVGRLKDIAWLPRQRRFTILLNRFRWEDCNEAGTRVRSALRFDSVLKVQSTNIRQGAPDAVISLLAVRFTPNGEADPGGVVELVMAGGGVIRLTVECIDAELADLTQPWAARGRPSHEGRF